MAERTKDQIAIFRDHPDADTAASPIYIRPVGTEVLQREIALVFGAEPGSEQEANAKFIVRSWGAHDQLVAALQYSRRMMKPDSDFAFVDAALAAAGVAP